MFGVLVLISVQHVDMPHNAVQYCMLRSTTVSTVLLCKQQCSYFLSSIFFVIHLCQRHELPWPRP